MSLTTEQQILIEQRITNEGKTTLAAFLFWWFLGILGGHRFYMGKTGTAILMLVLTLSVFGMVVSLIWWIVDAFLISGMVRDYNQNLRQRLTTDALMHVGAGAAAQAAQAPANPVQS